ncbi:MAG: hypothetical protein ACKO8Q_08870, partial [Bacteroidota bacterium]
KIKEMAPNLLKEQLVDSPEQIEAQLKQVNEEAESYESAMYTIRQEIAESDTRRSLFLAILAVGIMLVFLYIQNTQLRIAAIPIVGIIVLFDQLSVAQRYLNTEKEKGKYTSFIAEGEKQLPVKPSKADLSILKSEKTRISNFNVEAEKLRSAYSSSGMYDEVKATKNLDTLAEFGALSLNSNYRVLKLGNPFNDARTSFYHKSIGGYHGAKLKRYNELIDFYLSKQIQEVSAFQESKMDYLQSLSKLGNLTQAKADSIFMILDKQESEVMKKQGVLNMLNMKYLIFSSEAEANVNKYACGNAWFVAKVNAVANANDEMSALSNLDVYNESVTQEKFGGVFHSPSVSPDSTSTVELKKYATKELVYAASNNSGVELPVVFSEIYYPHGWKCLVDGNEVQYAPVNYVLRGMMLPPGNHEIVWKFDPEVWEKGNLISKAGSALFMLLLGVSGFFVWKQREQLSPQQKTK